jgi:hypothetical protein
MHSDWKLLTCEGNNQQAAALLDQAGAPLTGAGLWDEWKDKESGESSIAMEHYDIEDSFKRIIVPTIAAWEASRASVAHAHHAVTSQPRRRLYLRFGNS